jgi:hydroxymethylbilane synthase
MLVGTRSSKLAVLQAEMFVERLGKRNSKIERVSSHGDETQEKSLKEIGGTGLFVRRLNEMVLEGRLDCAVHSAKDMPGDLDDDLQVTAVFEWENYHDALLLRDDENINRKMRIGTSSPRREKQLSRIHPEWEFHNIRGNIDTRIGKLENGEYDGIVLSEAGIRRLFPGRRFMVLDEAMNVPAANQGIIAVVSRVTAADNGGIKSCEDPVARRRFDFEREVSSILDFGCSTPNGIFYHPIEKILYIDITSGETEVKIIRKILDLADARAIAHRVREMIA